MGQVASTPMLGRRFKGPSSASSSFRGSIRSVLLPRRSQTYQGNLSATFHCVDSDLKLNQLNINTATEEELMTLPGISRAVAQSIVEHRRAIGRFNKPEDLALVSGVGAEKLSHIRPEICVRKKMTEHGSIGSSHASSVESLDPSPISLQPPSPSPSMISRPAVNINSASVFELMSVRGLNQELAAAITEYRGRKGPFNSVDELTKVKGISRWKLSALRCQLTVGSPEQASNGKAVTLVPPPIFITNGSLSVIPEPHLTPSPSAPNGFLSNLEIFELLSSYCERPVVAACDNGSRPAIRLASWSLGSDFSVAKASNLGVQEVLCRTLLENRISVLALQGVCEEEALQKVCKELNNPKLRRVLGWKINSRVWKTSFPATVNKAGLGFIYDSQSVELQSIPAEINMGPVGETILPLPIGISAVLADFKVGRSEDMTISLLNVSVGLSPSTSSPVTGEFVERALAQRLGTKPRPLAILGDFTGLALGPTEESASNVQYKSVLPPNANTSSSKGTSYHDNIFLSREAQRVTTGAGGVVRQGLNHLAIPQGWEWNGAISSHCPVWCELKMSTL